MIYHTTFSYILDYYKEHNIKIKYPSNKVINIDFENQLNQSTNNKSKIGWFKKGIKETLGNK